MLRILTVSMLFFVFSNTVFSQEVTSVHEIQKGTEPNEYIIKTTIKGLEGADIARAIYKIDDVHTYKKVLGNELFTSRNKEHIKFYVMGIPTSGMVTIELGLILSDEGKYSFPVEFQYSRNEEKKTVQFPELVFSESAILAAVGKSSETIKNPSSSSVVKKTETISTLPSDKKVVAAEEVKEGLVKEATAEVEKPVAKEEIVSEETPTIKEELADTKIKYTIQILSLSNFSQARFDEYCEEHSLLEEEVSTREVNGVTKVTFRVANSLDEAKKLVDRLKLLNNIDGAFAIPLK